MRIVRNDTEALVWQNKNYLRPVATVPILFLAVIMVGAWVHALTHAPPLLVFVLVSIGGLGLFFYTVPTCITFVFARQSRRFMVVRRYLARQTRQEFEYDDVQFVRLKPGPRGTNTLQIVLDSGKKIFVEIYSRSRLRPMRADTVFLCEALEQPEPVFRKTLGEHVQAIYQKLTG
jgi:hypothetical protein